MGCSNTTNNKKNKEVKSKKGNEEKVENSGNSDFKSDSKVENKKDSNSSKKENYIEEEETREIPKGCIELRVNADTTERMFPIWVEKGSKVKIHVRGRWSLLPEYGEVDYKGHANFNYKYRDANIGALMGRILGGNYFKIINGMILVPQISGPIFFFANNSRLSVQPSGFLNVFIENAKKYSMEEIELMSGWKINELDTTRGHDYLTNEEKSLIICINKIKKNPKLFATQYLSHLTILGESYREIYNKLMIYPTSKLLKPSKPLYMAARDHAKDIGENGTTGHTSTDGSDLRQRISRYSPNPSYFGENCSYGLNDPLSIVIQMVVDDGFQTRAHRANILNEIYSQVGISIQPHSSYKFTCVQVFGSNIVELER